MADGKRAGGCDGDEVTFPGGRGLSGDVVASDANRCRFELKGFGVDPKGRDRLRYFEVDGDRAVEPVFARRYMKVGGISKRTDDRGQAQLGRCLLGEAGDGSEAEGEEGKCDESSHARHDKPAGKILKRRCVDNSLYSLPRRHGRKRRPGKTFFVCVVSFQFKVPQLPPPRTRNSERGQLYRGMTMIA